MSKYIMNIPDIINSFCGVFICGLVINNAIVLLKHKSVKGFSTFSVLGFFLIGIWNIYYYNDLHQWFSFISAIGIVSANIFYIFLIFKYK